MSEDQDAETKQRVKVPKGTRDIHPEEMMLRERCFEIVKNIFRRHGAKEIETPVFELKEVLIKKYGEDSKLIYDLADQGGESLSLRYDLTVPFARYLGTHRIRKMKRYQIARVYRRDNPVMSRGRYREFYQCDYDIVGEHAAMVPEAECLKVLVEVLTDLHIGSFVIKLSHRKILDAVLSLAGVPSDKLHSIASSIDKLDKEEWTQVKKEMMEKGIQEAAVDQIGSYILAKKRSECESSDPRQLLQVLQKDESLMSDASARKAVLDLRALFTYLETFGILNKVKLDLSLARGLDYYTGVIFEAILLENSNVGSVAAGGRYDELIGSLSSDEQLPAVGVSIGIERLISILQQAKRNAIEKTKTYSLVLVASIGPNLLKERMELCNQLWEAGIPAEFLYHENPRAKKQAAYADEQGIPFICWIGENELKQGVFTIKDLSSGVQQMIAQQDVVSHFENILLSRDGATSRSTRAVLEKFERRATEAEKRVRSLEERISKLEQYNKT